ncbi:hypothetical protein LCGC14_1846820 [marine sediment metagenome]|uniref:Terminase small subunit protein n=1 Tax=marine sediment metagenome TaxID=412755 RepID=A0A0F9GBH5_9ZZZZ
MTKPNGKPKPRRSTEYDEKIAAEVCNRVAAGEGLRAICKDPGFPCHQIIYQWLAAEPTFMTAYTRAREAQMEVWAEDCTDIADDATNDFMERINKAGTAERVPDPETVQRSKLRIDTRLRLMAKLNARRFGDKVEVELSGSVKVQTMTDAELEAQTRLMLVDLGVEVAAPLLLTQDDKESEPAPAVDNG